MTQRDADRRSGTWLTCWSCGDWYGPLSETVKREKPPETCPLTGDEIRPAPPPKLWPACPKCGGFL